MSWSIFNRRGQRKYLTAGEVDLFTKSAGKCTLEIHSFCLMLAFSGCRISEALEMTTESIDFETGYVTIRCLKKRGKLVFRAVPLPPRYLSILRRLCHLPRPGSQRRLWPWSRMTGYRRICDVMCEAGIRGDHASPKGLRHAFGVRAIQSGIPLNLVQRWLGHADIKTTAIYTDVMGSEEREIAARMWRKGAGKRRPHKDARSAREPMEPENPRQSASPREQPHTQRSSMSHAPWAGTADIEGYRFHASALDTVVIAIEDEVRDRKILHVKEHASCSLIQYWL